MSTMYIIQIKWKSDFLKIKSVCKQMNIMQCTLHLKSILNKTDYNNEFRFKEILFKIFIFKDWFTIPLWFGFDGDGVPSGNWSIILKCFKQIA